MNKDFLKNFKRKYSLRLHMSCLMMFTFSMGSLANYLLRELVGIQNLTGRYALTVVASYLAFLLGVRIWLFFITPKTQSSSKDSSDSLDVIDGINVGLHIPSSNPQYSGSGGDSSGGGADGSWGDSLPSIELDDDSGGLVIVLVGLLVMLSAVISVLYLIWSAPSILSEIAFEMFITLGIIRRPNKENLSSWLPVAFKKTIIPFGVVLILTSVFTLTVNHYQPSAHRFREINFSEVIKQFSEKDKP